MTTTQIPAMTVSRIPGASAPDPAQPRPEGKPQRTPVLLGLTLTSLFSPQLIFDPRVTR